jgi:hypothetical protein
VIYSCKKVLAIPVGNLSKENHILWEWARTDTSSVFSDYGTNVIVEAEQQHLGPPRASPTGSFS